jgi:hypothetical protein
MEKMSRFWSLLSAGAMIMAVPRGAAGQTPPEGSRAGHAPSGANDERAQEARSRYERGLQLYNEGAAEGALVEFERAYQLAPTYKLLYNIALIRLQLNDYAQAMKAFQEYLAEGGAEISSVRRSEVERQVASLRTKVGRLEITSNVRGGDVLIDDVVVGRLPLPELVIVNPGRRRVTVTRGGLSSTTVVTVAGQDYLKVDVPLDSSKPQVEMPVASSPSRAPAYVAWTLTGALAAGAAVTGVLALDAMSDLDAERARVPTTRSRLDDANSKMVGLALVTDILAGATVVAGATALFFTLSKPSAETSSKGGGLRLGVGPTGIRLENRF